MQWKMYRPFLRAPPQLVLERANDPKIIYRTRLLQLPHWLLDAVFEHLDILDRCSLALCCKYLIKFARDNEHLEYVIQQPPKIEELQYFFERQLGRGWIPTDLRYCYDCGKFVSTSATHWRHVSEKYTREHSGRISEIWRGRREDGWLRYWIERWCDSNVEQGDVTSVSLRQEDTTRLLCPRCAIQNPDCNTWRHRRVDFQNMPTTLDHRPTTPSFRYPSDSPPYQPTISWPSSALTISLSPSPVLPPSTEDNFYRYFAPSFTHTPGLQLGFSH